MTPVQGLKTVLVHEHVHPEGQIPIPVLAAPVRCNAWFGVVSLAFAFPFRDGYLDDACALPP